MRYVLEGKWSNEETPCYREVIARPSLFGVLRGIKFRDGRCLELSIRPAKVREKVVRVGYSDIVYRASRMNKEWVNEDDIGT